jgi:sulfur-carrier protein
MPVVKLRSGPLRALADGGGEHAVAGDTVRTALGELERMFPAMGGWILDERGRIRRHINVFVNGVHGTEDTAVGEGDRVEVLQAISGG